LYNNRSIFLEIAEFFSNFSISRVSSAALLTSLILVSRETLLQARLLLVVLSAATFSMALVQVQSGGVTILAGF